MMVGYMRVSSAHDRQTTDLQRDALLDAGVDPRQLFADQASGARDDRPGLQQALAYVQPGDCLIVWKVDRLGRSLPALLQIVTTLQATPAWRDVTAARPAGPLRRDPVVIHPNRQGRIILPIDHNLEPSTGATCRDPRRIRLLPASEGSLGMQEPWERR